MDSNDTFILSSSDDNSTKNNKDKSCAYFNDDSQEQQEEEPVHKKPKFIKTEDDSIPLQDPFPLPKHFRGEVELALSSGKMTKETMSSFLSAVASAMLVFKRYPSKEDYICVARSVIKKYPFMSAPVGTPYVSGIHTLYFGIHCYITIWSKNKTKTKTKKKQ